MGDPMQDAAAPIDIGDVSEVQEAEQLPDGLYDFTVKSASLKSTTLSKGEHAGQERQQLLLVLEADGQGDDFEPVFDKVFLPDDRDTPEQQKTARRNLKRRASALGVDLSGGLVAADFKGKSASSLQVKGRLVEGDRYVDIRWPKF